MIARPCDDPILKRFRASVDEIYGDRIERVMLFGSRARGEAHQDSDYDVAVFLKNLTDRRPEKNRPADLRTGNPQKTGQIPPPTLPARFHTRPTHR